MAFDNNKLGELRPNQIITTFGPGSVVDAVKDSVTILDISYWKQKGQKIIDGRLASYLGVDCFYMPRTSFSGDIPVVTFPYWHVCSNLKCGRLFDARKNFDLDKYLKYGVTCPECHRPAYPSRFITICEDGHMSDFPWKWWVHKGDSDCNGTLKMYSTGNTSTLADMWVECSCGAKRSMNGATQRENFEDIACPGHHPFRPSVKNQRCNKPVIPSQRGASNVYFAVSRSAISIPPWINPLYNLIDEHLRDIELAKQLMGDEGITKIYEMYFSAYTRNEFDEALERRMSNIKEFTEIKQMEYNAITHHNDPAYESNKKHFKAEEDALLEEIISKINERFDGIFSEGDRVIVETLYNRAKENKKRNRQAQKNDEEVYTKSIFPEVFKQVAQDCYIEQMKAFSKLFEDKRFYDTVMATLAQETYRHSNDCAL